MIRQLILLLLSSWFTIAANGQAISDSLAPTDPSYPLRINSLSLRIHQGIISANTTTLTTMNYAFPLGIEAGWDRQILTRKAWETCNCFPRLGVALVFLDYRLPNVLGHSLNAVAFAEPVFRATRKLHFSFRAGFGFAYTSLPFDSVSNPLNKAYSMHWAFAEMFSLGINYRLSPHLRIKFAANVNHASNAGIKRPNGGLNCQSLSLGMDYSFEDRPLPAYEKRKRTQWKEHPNRLSFSWISSVTDEWVNWERQHYYLAGMDARYSRFLGASSAVSAGVEAILDPALQEKIRQSQDPERSAFRVGLLAGHEFWLGRVTLSTLLGIYLVDKWKEDGPVYQRYFITIAPVKKLPFLFAGFGGKFHLGELEFVELRLGVKL